MKKTYNSPKVLVVLLDTQDMICGSLDPVGGKGTVSEEFVKSGTAGESRRGSSWDDED